jgi:hypothetical protein
MQGVCQDVDINPLAGLTPERQVELFAEYLNEVAVNWPEDTRRDFIEKLEFCPICGTMGEDRGWCCDAVFNAVEE